MHGVYKEIRISKKFNRRVSKQKTRKRVYGLMLKWIEIIPSGALNGSVKVPGSKNSSLALLAASCMADGPVRLQGIPDLFDIKVIQEIFHDIGVSMMRLDGGDLIIDPRFLASSDLDIEKTSAFRASYYFVGALLAKQKEVRISYPGGDDFVSRPIDQHFKVLKALGANIELLDTYYVVKADRLVGTDIYFDVITSGATINALLASATALGTTVLRNAALDPEVVDTANMLNQMGARIRGAGTSTIRVEGVKELGGCTYSVIPDRLIAGAFLMAAAATQGIVTVEGAIPDHLASFLSKMEEIGVGIEVNEQKITAYGDVRLKAVRARTGMYPGFATDLQQPLTPVMLRAHGKSIITERVYPKRFNHVQQLNRMGANIEVKGPSAWISGVQPLHGGLVHASDVRAGVSLIIAGLMAEGSTVITGVEHVERGYEDIVGSFSSLGAKLALKQGEQLEGEQACLRKNVARK